MSLADKIEETDRKKRDELLDRLASEANEHGTEAYNRRVFEEAQQLLEESGANDYADIVINAGSGWGRKVETPTTDKDGIYVGIDLLVKSLGGGGSDYYYGDGFVIRAVAAEKSVIVLSGNNPIKILPDASDGWTEDRKKVVETAVLEAYKNPGGYRWYEGMYSEEWNVKMYSVETR